MFAALKSVLRKPVNLPQVCRSLSELTPLSNGFRVATEETNSSVVSLSLFVEGGPRYENACYSGITHFIQHMAFKGFQSMSREALEKDVQLNGAQIWSKTTHDMLVLGAQCLPEYTDKIVQIFYNVFTDLLLDRCEIEKTRKDIMKELNDADNDPKRVAFDYLHSSAYQGTPFGQNIMGNMENVAKFDKTYIQSFMDELVKPRSMVLTASGSVNHGSFVRAATNTFGKLPEETCTDKCYGMTRYTGSQVMYRDDSIPLAHIIIAVEASGRRHSDYHSLKVLKYMMGSWRKGQGFVQYEAGVPNKDPEKCELYESFYTAYEDTGLWGIYFVAPSLDLEDMVYNIQDRWMSACSCLTNAEVERAVNEYKIKLARKHGSSKSNCRDIGMQVMYTGARMDLCDTFGIIDSLNVAKVQSVANNYLFDRCPVVAAIGPTEGLPEYNRLRSGMYWLRV